MLRIPSWPVLISALCLMLMLAAGLVVYDDYGAAWDDKAQIDVGIANFDYITGDNTFLLEFRDRYYGPVFETLLYAITRRMEPRTMMLTRHLLTFLLYWVSLVAFYCLSVRINRRWWLALIAVLFLALSPRILGDAFYNSKDIPFMALFIISALTLARLLERQTFANVLLHALATALRVALRVPGILMMGVTIAVIVTRGLSGSDRSTVYHWLGITLGYLVMTAVLVLLFWPVLWVAPVQNLLNALREMSHYPWLGQSLYKGVMITGTVPWTYAPTWILITTPIIVLAWGAVGGVSVLWSVFARKPLLKPEHALLILLWLGVPLAMVIGLRSTLYDGWRQLYFVYPALVLLAVSGMQFAAQRLHAKPALIVLAALTLLGLAEPVSHVIGTHPLEAIYFNDFAGSDIGVIKYRYELDYWGTSYRLGLEWIATNDHRALIKVMFPNPEPGYSNWMLLPAADRQRIEVTTAIEEAQYYVTSYRCHPEPYEFPHEVYSYQRDGTSIMSVFALP